MHKSPYKARFIAGSKTCTTKLLSTLLTRALQTVQSFWTKYCVTIKRNSDVNCMWILNNSKRLTDELDAEAHIPYKEVSTWDFSTLYTTIPRDDLIDRISSLIASVYNKSGHRYINVSNNKAFFSSKEYKGYHSWDVALFVELLEFLINNIYVKFGNTVYQ